MLDFLYRFSINHTDIQYTERKYIYVDIFVRQFGRVSTFTVTLPQFPSLWFLFNRRKHHPAFHIFHVWMLAVFPPFNRLAISHSTRERRHFECTRHAATRTVLTNAWQESYARQRQSRFEGQTIIDVQNTTIIILVAKQIMTLHIILVLLLLGNSKHIPMGFTSLMHFLWQIWSHLWFMLHHKLYYSAAVTIYIINIKALNMST